MIEPGGRGGVADYTAALTAALADAGVAVTLVTARDHVYPPHPGVAVRGRFSYVRGGSPARDALRRLRIHKAVNGVAYVAAHVRSLRDVRAAGAVHVQGFENAPLGIAALAILRAAGRPVVHTPHNTFARGARVAPGLRAMFALPDRLVVHTEHDRAALPPRARRRARVIPHGDYGELARRAGDRDRDGARAELGVAPGATVALVFGQLRPDKGVGDVLEAAAAVPGLHVVLAGADLGAPLEDPRLAGRLTVRATHQDDAGMATAFAAADVSVLAYRQASMSGVLLLSYGFGVPVVVYPAGGLPEAVVDGETGWIAGRSDPEALAVTLAAAVEAGGAERRRRGAAGRRLAHERYGWPQIARRTAAVYAELRAGARKRDAPEGAARR